MANLEKAHLVDVTIDGRGGTLIGLSFANASLRRVTFRNLTLIAPVLDGALLADVTFDNVVLVAADLTRLRATGELEGNLIRFPDDRSVMMEVGLPKPGELDIKGSPRQQQGRVCAYLKHAGFRMTDGIVSLRTRVDCYPPLPHDADDPQSIIKEQEIAIDRPDCLLARFTDVTSITVIGPAPDEGSDGPKLDRIDAQKDDDDWSGLESAMLARLRDLYPMAGPCPPFGKADKILFVPGNKEPAPAAAPAP